MSKDIANQLFLVYLGRPADVAWRKSTADLLNSAAPPVALQNAFFSAAVLEGVYSLNDSPSALVNKIFQNIFGFGANGFEQQQWGDLITKGVITAQTAAWTIFNSYLGATNLGALSDAYQVPARSKLIAVDAYTNELGNNGAANVAVSQVGGAAAASARTVIAGVTSIETAAPVVNGISTTVNNAATAATGSTFVLTAGADSFTGTSGNDTFTANPGVTNAGVAEVTTLTLLDILDGGAGTDTLNVTSAGAAKNFTLPTTATLRNIEILNVNAEGTVTADVSGFSGFTTVLAKAVGDTTITSKSNVTSVTVSGAAAKVTVDDSGTAATTADKVATVSVTGYTDVVAVKSDVLTSLSLATGAKDVTVTAAAGARALTINTSGVTGGVLKDDEATTVSVNNTTTATTGATLTAGKATTVNVSATGAALTLADVNIAAATSLKATGDRLVTITATTAVGALTSVDASASTGGLTIGAAIAVGVAFTGGSGKDSVSIGATTKAITTGDGDDTVTFNGVAALGTGGSVDFGGGTGDTLKFTTFANAVTGSSSTALNGVISNVERVEINGANATGGATVNLTNLKGVSFVTYSANNGETTTISNMASGGTLAFTSSQTAGKAHTVGVTNAATGTSDVLNLSISSAGALTGIEVVAANVETINITSTDTAATATGITHAFGAAGLSATAATTLTISGSAGLNLGTLTGATALTSIDASGVTQGTVTLTTAALGSAATIKGAATAANTIVATAATKAVNFTGGNKVDTITINNAQNNVIDTGDGDDVIVTGAGADTITAGAGADTITSGKGLDSLTGGAGNDTFVLAASDNGNIFASIKDAAAGDRLQFTDKGTETFATAKLSLGSTAVFQDYLNLAAAGDGNTNGAISWFTFNGATYVVEDLSAGASFVNGTDIVVEITGTALDLSKATGTGSNILTLV